MHFQIYQGALVDENRRQVSLVGLNVDAMAKMPSEPELTTFDHDPRFFDGDNVSFVGRPFSIDEAETNFALIKSWGFNTLRYIFTWEAIEHGGPGKYDYEFIDYTVQILKIAEKHGFYVFMDPHQDVWGRFSGGSGAPLWTYYAAGLDPHSFAATHAAIVQNTMESPEEMPKMLWPTNYYRLVCQVMFTLFFAGEHFAPKAIINGVNIQHFLQEHFTNACIELYNKINEAGLFESCVFGVENVNEPNMGLIGFEDISKLPTNQNLRLSSTPTALQSMILGTGKAQVVGFYLFGSLGPKARGTVTVDPKGVSAWVQDDTYDKKYGFRRDPGWQLGRCIWAQHGVWDDTTDTVLIKSYFAEHGGNQVDEDYAVNVFYRQYWSHHMQRMREVLPPQTFLLCQPPTLAKPPNLKGTDLIDDKFIYSPHYYDGLTLMLKRWSSVWNVDALGYLRGRYKFPVFALKLGESSIRHSLQKQLDIISKERAMYLGDVPLLMSETGIPMDMNDKESYTNNNYTSQIKALDAITSAIEAHLMHVTYWAFSSNNTHDFGDRWNKEDFSFLSANGTRAKEAWVRPGPRFIVGKLVRSRFYLSYGYYHLVIDAEPCTEDNATVLFIPKLHFEDAASCVDVSSGHVSVDGDYLTWVHDGGRQTLHLTAATPTLCTIS